MQNDNHNMKFNIINYQKIYDGFCKVFKIKFNHTKFDGSVSNTLDHELFVRQPCVGVLPYNPNTDEIILIEQFRIGAIDPLKDFQTNFNPWVLEIVAGVIDKKNESPESTAIRECIEEAGCTVDNLIPMHDYLVSPGANNERIKLYCGIFSHEYKPGLFGLDHENEDIKTYIISLDEARELLSSGKICNAASIVAIQWLLLNKHKILDLV